MPNLYTCVSVGTNVRTCGTALGLPVGTRGTVTKILLWTDKPTNQEARICIDWYDDDGNVRMKDSHTLSDFCPHGGLIASFGDFSEIDEKEYRNHVVKQISKYGIDNI